MRNITLLHSFLPSYMMDPLPEDQTEPEDDDTIPVYSSSLHTPPAVIYTNLVGPSHTKAKRLRREPSALIDCHRVLTKTFGHEDYKGKQREIVEAAVRGADIFVLAPTGMGKSICFQVPAVADLHGTTIVVSPLLALMKDQVSGLREKGINVASLTSETSPADRKEIIRDLSSGHTVNRLLYITPEKLCTPEFLQLLSDVYENQELNRLVVDEAHCISEWGHDFRAEYRRLGIFRRRFENIPIMALTATATPSVQQDIIRSLGMSEQHLVKVIHPFNRANLYYEVRYLSAPKAASQMADIVEYIFTLYERRQRPSSGIIYCRTRAGCDELSAYLRGRGINSRPYHRGIPAATLDRTLTDWSRGGDGSSGVDVVCATIAFGLGIDKGDVRYILHYDLPKSFEGRAGRDGSPSKCVLFYSREDVIRVKRWVSSSHSRRTAVANRGDGPQPSQHALDSLTSLVQFAESTDICRHVVGYFLLLFNYFSGMELIVAEAICRYFGEPIDLADAETVRKYCNKMCDICKYPEKTKQRAAGLSSEEFAVTQIPAHIPRALEDDSGAWPSRNNSRDTAGRKDAYVQSNNHKRSWAEGNDKAGPSRYKKSKNTSSNPYIKPLVTKPFQSVKNLSKPFKTPFLVPTAAAHSAPDTAEVEEEERENDRTIYPDPPDETEDNAEEDDDFDDSQVLHSKARGSRSSSPIDLPEAEGELELLHSRKIQSAQRHRALATIRKVLYKVFLHGSDVETMWEQLGDGGADADAEARGSLLDEAAYSLEFTALSMCSTAGGYERRAEGTVEAVRFLGENAGQWNSPVRREDEWEDAVEVLKVLRQVCGAG
ncbi:P-loop containing nucleoside triphosphate hydrolase protein [Mycena pura]|uniref:DNA 3'-5' helicase n=1 Tax=Mycena pura TaxID=153505 RepID=A0AAD6VK47_9AGAR|nr:P-loop containing nucleoside triphosphate hydrolase protein [Mycena pura]